MSAPRDQRLPPAPLQSTAAVGARGGCVRIFLIFLGLGLTSFGGPAAHLGYFRAAFVQQRGWLSEAEYADLVALCQFLPGPASSQVGMALGLRRGGYAGALAAWLGFTLPSAWALALFAQGLTSGWARLPAGALHGLHVAAVAAVAHAVWGMAGALCRGAVRSTLMVATACAALLAPAAATQVAAIALAALVGFIALRRENGPLPATRSSVWMPSPGQRSVATPATREVDAQAGASAPGWRSAVAWLVMFVLLLIGLPAAASLTASAGWAVAAAFYRAGALVFGGGHVVLPLLESAVVAPGWVAPGAFMAGYGAAQGVPGPLFTFAAFLGASLRLPVTGWAGAALAVGAIFLPSFLLLAGTLPLWARLARHAGARSALAGVQAAVVGLLLGALYDPLWRQAIVAPRDVALALVAAVALAGWKWPPWLVVAMCCAAGWAAG